MDKKNIPMIFSLEPSKASIDKPLRRMEMGMYYQDIFAGILLLYYLKIMVTSSDIFWISHPKFYNLQISDE